MLYTIKYEKMFLTGPLKGLYFWDKVQTSLPENYKAGTIYKEIYTNNKVKIIQSKIIRAR